MALAPSAILFHIALAIGGCVYYSSISAQVAAGAEKRKKEKAAVSLVKVPPSSFLGSMFAR